VTSVVPRLRGLRPPFSPGQEGRAGAGGHGALGHEPQDPAPLGRGGALAGQPERGRRGGRPRPARGAGRAEGAAAGPGLPAVLRRRRQCVAFVDSERQMPNLWWPADRSWCVASDGDLAWTYIGGSAELARRLESEARIEVLPASPKDSHRHPFQGWLASQIDDAVGAPAAGRETTIETSQGTVHATAPATNSVTDYDRSKAVVVTSSWAITCAFMIVPTISVEGMLASDQEYSRRMAHHLATTG